MWWYHNVFLTALNKEIVCFHHVTKGFHGGVLTLDWPSYSCVTEWHQSACPYMQFCNEQTKTQRIFSPACTSTIYDNAVMCRRKNGTFASMCNWFQNKSRIHTFAVVWDTWHVNCYFNGASPTGSPRWSHYLQRQLACEWLHVRGRSWVAAESGDLRSRAPHISKRYIEYRANFSASARMPEVVVKMNMATSRQGFSCGKSHFW